MEASSMSLQIAAQNCRRRKVDQISVLEEEVAVVRRRKERLQEEREELEESRRKFKEKLGVLEQYVISILGTSSWDD